MKKTVYVMVLFVLLLSLIACGKKNKTDDVTQSIADFFDKFMESIFQEYLERSIKTYLRGDSGFSSQNFMKPVRVMAVSY